ncbi:hypothetical protein IKE79_00785, partial [Candidatus Saccharibacteria bacterium]|nr:hypothetical protein [Candidatus Saccharibacteria bacterium]
TIANNDLASEGAILYANWIPAEKNCTMQNFIDTPECINKIETSTVIALRDTRDDNIYAVAKLADGKYWMIENLRLDSTPELNSNNTNVPSNWGGMTNTIDQSTGDIVSGPSNHLTTSGDTAEYWCNKANNASCYNQARLNSNNATTPATSMTNPTAQNVYGYGNYYNWYSATAGYGTQSDGTNNTSEEYSICPANWKLPRGGASINASNSDFWQLGLKIMGKAPYNNSSYQSIADDIAVLNSSSTNSIYKDKYATQAYRMYPNNFLLSGYQNSNITSNRGSLSYYWSSTTYSTLTAYASRLEKANVSPGTYANNNYSLKYYGFAVRCLVGS